MENPPRARNLLSLSRLSLSLSNRPGVILAGVTLVPSLEHRRFLEVREKASQSRPDSGIGFQLKVLETFQVVLCELGSGKP